MHLLLIKCLCAIDWKERRRAERMSPWMSRRMMDRRRVHNLLDSVRTCSPLANLWRPRRSNRHRRLRVCPRPVSPDRRPLSWRLSNCSPRTIGTERRQIGRSWWSLGDLWDFCFWMNRRAWFCRWTVWFWSWFSCRWWQSSIWGICTCFCSPRSSRWCSRARLPVPNRSSKWTDWVSCREQRNRQWIYNSHSKEEYT